VFPQHVKEHWAQKLCEGEYGIEAIRDAWPQTYGGVDEHGTFIDFDADLEHGYGDPIVRRITVEETMKVKPTEILAAFEAVRFDCFLIS
jgi:hypothetical protein